MRECGIERHKERGSLEGTYVYAMGLVFKRPFHGRVVQHLELLLGEELLSEVLGLGSRQKRHIGVNLEVASCCLLHRGDSAGFLHVREGGRVSTSLRCRTGPSLCLGV